MARSVELQTRGLSGPGGDRPLSSAEISRELPILCPNDAVVERLILRDWPSETIAVSDRAHNTARTFAPLTSADERAPRFHSRPNAATWMAGTRPAMMDARRFPPGARCANARPPGSRRELLAHHFPQRREVLGERPYALGELFGRHRVLVEHPAERASRRARSSPARRRAISDRAGGRSSPSSLASSASNCGEIVRRSQPASAAISPTLRNEAPITTVLMS